MLLKMYHVYMYKNPQKTMQHVDEVEVENISVKKIIHWEEKWWRPKQRI